MPTRFSTTLIIAGTLAALLTPTATAEVDTRNLTKAFRLQQKGERAFSSGNPGAAEKQYNAALELVPTLPPALIGLGHIAMSRGEFGAALDYFARAQAGYANLGDAMMEIEMKRYANAQEQIVALRDSIQQLQTYSAGAAQGGGADQTPLKIAKLENQITQLEVIKPPQQNEAGEPPAEIHFYIGNALFQLERIDEAIAAWETCRERSPKYAMVYNNLALAYGRQGRLQDAVASLQKAEELGFPVNPQFKADLLKASGGS